MPRIAKVDVFRTEGIPVGPALISQLSVMAATGRRNDQALSARIPFMAAGPSKARTLQAAYMTATVSMPHVPQNTLALACERGPYMTDKAAGPARPKKSPAEGGASNSEQCYS